MSSVLAYEENETRETAYDLSTHKAVWLSSVAGLGIQADDDWYKISASAAGARIIADLRFTHADGDIDIALFDGSGNHLIGSYGTSDNEFIDYKVTQGGDYWLLVNYENAGNTYDLKWNTHKTRVVIYKLLLLKKR